ncbi:hypothetical protein Pelo_14820 [Pelomyxa schiedti]|nr:hypothetical protein Pelo_14820 [Pelomyxa schiedti]
MVPRIEVNEPPPPPAPPPQQQVQHAQPIPEKPLEPPLHPAPMFSPRRNATEPFNLVCQLDVRYWKVCPDPEDLRIITLEHKLAAADIVSKTGAIPCVWGPGNDCIEAAEDIAGQMDPARAVRRVDFADVFSMSLIEEETYYYMSTKQGYWINLFLPLSIFLISFVTYKNQTRKISDMRCQGEMLLVTGEDPTILRTLENVPLTFLNVMNPMITPPVAIELLSYLFKTDPVESLFGTSVLEIEHNINLVSVALYASPLYFRQFLAKIKAGPHENIVETASKGAFITYNELHMPLFPTRGALSELRKLFLTKKKTWISGEKVHIQADKKDFTDLMAIGTVLNTSHLALIIPKKDGADVYMPFSYAYNLLQLQVDLPSRVQQFVLRTTCRLMVEEADSPFIGINLEQLSLPSSPLMIKCLTMAHCHSVPHLHPNFITVSEVTQESISITHTLGLGIYVPYNRHFFDYMFEAQRKLPNGQCCAIYLKFKMLRSSALSVITKELKLFFQIASEEPTDGVYFFLSQSHVTQNTITSCLPTQPISFNKGYHVISGPDLLSCCPEIATLEGVLGGDVNSAATAAREQALRAKH